MCQLVTVGISGYEDDPVKVFQSAGLHAESAVNPDVRAALPAGWLAFDITDGYCSCSVYRGPGGKSQEDELAHWRQRYERKGWKGAKIERALQSKRADRDRRPDPAADFARAVEHIIKGGATVAIIAHSFGGLFAEKPVSIRSQCTLSLSDYLAGNGAIPEDTVVTVR